MKHSRSNLPLLFKVANALGGLLVVLRLPLIRLDEQAVCSAAIKKTGLTDFGDSHYREGLLQFLDSARNEANLHPLGRFIAQYVVTNYLVQRLRLVETLKQAPEIFRKPINPPLIITGLARAGTTFLHNILALNPAHHALPQWLLMQPFPEANWNGKGRDPRLVKMEWAFRFLHLLLPDIDSKHYSRAETPEECLFAMGLTFNSLIFSTLFPVPGYAEWFTQQEDSLQTYREYGWLLQSFQSQIPDQRLILKAPAHTRSLGTLLKAVPNAMLIQTHRDPVASIGSVCSLLSTYYLAMANEIDLHRIGNLTLRGYESGLRRNLAFRAENPGLVYDVFYDLLVSDPIGTVQRIYSHFGLPWTDTYENRIKEFIRKNPKDKHGKHHYTVSDFGLTESEITDRLHFYTEHFGL